MIFVTVGSQLPFDRLVRAVDDWCVKRRGTEVFAQIADPGPRGYFPRNFEWERFLSPEEFDRRFSEARLIIAHAGMGSIISALMAAKPIVIMPRCASLNEHRSDHQHATAQKFLDRANVHVAMDESELPVVVDSALSQPIQGEERVHAHADESLILSLRNFILSSGRNGSVS